VSSVCIRIKGKKFCSPPTIKDAMQKIHAFKRGIRALGVAESFDPRVDEKSLLAGVVMRGDLVVDGVALGATSVGGYDATESIIELYDSLKRNDINLIMLSGAVLSHYNIVDLEKLSFECSKPVLCLTYKESRGLEEALKRSFNEFSKAKLHLYGKLQSREPIRLKTCKTIFVRRVSISLEDTFAVLNLFTLQGKFPEPIRLAKIVAAAARKLRWY
jgi:endonuclease V-like protein UPF0215 family